MRRTCGSRASIRTRVFSSKGFTYVGRIWVLHDQGGEQRLSLMPCSRLRGWQTLNEGHKFWSFLNRPLSRPCAMLFCSRLNAFSEAANWEKRGAKNPDPRSLSIEQYISTVLAHQTAATRLFIRSNFDAVSSRPRPVLKAS